MPTLDQRTVASITAYGSNARAYQEALRRRRPSNDARRFATLAEAGALILDAGCGPASDLRLLRDVGLRPVGIDLALPALREARMLLPKQALVQAPYDRLPFRPRSFGGLWLSGAFVHLPRAAWEPTFASLLGQLGRGPVYFSCTLGVADLAPVDDPILGRVFRTDAAAAEVETLFTANGLVDVVVETRPDPLLERAQPWVVAFGRRLVGDGREPRKGPAHRGPAGSRPEGDADGAG